MNVDALRTWLERHAGERLDTSSVDVAPLQERLTRTLHERGWRVRPAERSAGSLDGLPEVTLWRNAHAHCQESFEILFGRYAARLLAMLKRWPSLEDPEGIAQEAFLVFCQTDPDTRKNANVEGFLFATARNRARNELRRALRRQVLTREDLDTLTSNDPSPLDELVRRSQREDLVRSLSVTCDPLEQEVVLQVLTGHSNAEIATHLEIKKTHIAVLKHRALTKLRARLEASP